MRKIVLITGCSSGFGMLSAARLSFSGHTVYASMRDLSKSSDLKVELERRDTNCHMIELDVVMTFLSRIRSIRLLNKKGN